MKIHIEGDLDHADIVMSGVQRSWGRESWTAAFHSQEILPVCIVDAEGNVVGLGTVTIGGTVKADITDEGMLEKLRWSNIDSFSIGEAKPVRRMPAAPPMSPPSVDDLRMADSLRKMLSQKPKTIAEAMEMIRRAAQDDHTDEEAQLPQRRPTMDGLVESARQVDDFYANREDDE